MFKADFNYSLLWIHAYIHGRLIFKLFKKRTWALGYFPPNILNKMYVYNQMSNRTQQTEIDQLKSMKKKGLNPVKVKCL